MRHRHLLGWPALMTLALWPMAHGILGAPSSDKEKKVTLTIKGMTCGGCVAAVKLKLKQTKGVVAYEVSLERGEADVTYDPALTSPEAIAAAVSETGFAATVKARDRGHEDRKGDERNDRSGLEA